MFLNKGQQKTGVKIYEMWDSLLLKLQVMQFFQKNNQFINILEEIWPQFQLETYVNYSCLKQLVLHNSSDYGSQKQTSKFKILSYDPIFQNGSSTLPR